MWDLASELAPTPCESARWKNHQSRDLKQSRKLFPGLQSDLWRFISVTLCRCQHCSQPGLWHLKSLALWSETLHGTNANCSYHICAKLMPDLKNKQHGIFADKHLQFLKPQSILFNCLLSPKVQSWNPKESVLRILCIGPKFVDTRHMALE